MRDKLNLLIITFSLLILISLACGTVHQFMPPQPLKPNEFRGMMTYSFDFNKFAPLGCLNFGFYFGSGKETNLGFGFQPPLGISHLTAIKYFNSDKSTYGRVYGSLNDLTITIDASPDFQFGGSILHRAGTAYHALSLGGWALFKESIDESGNRTIWAAKVKRISSPYIGPTIAYEFANGDFTFSLLNHKKLSKSVIYAERYKLENRQRIVIPVEDIDFFLFDFNTRRIGITLKNRDVFSITPKTPYPDAIIPETDKLRLDKFKPKDNWDYFFVTHQVELKLYELDFGALISDYVGKKDIVLASFPPRKREIGKMIKWYKHDWSIGLGMKL